MVKYSENELVLIWLDSFIGLEYKHKQQLFSMISGKVSIKKLISSGKDYIVSQIGESHFDTLLASANDQYLSYLLENYTKKQIRLVTIFSNEYPESLKQTPHPPLVLYAKGNVELLKQEKFAIVGSRKSLPLSIAIAKDYANAIIDADLCLVTGNAEGIDATVIQTALDRGGKVISVIAGGYDNIYPKTNCMLLDKVSQNGLVISESLPEVLPRPYMFPVRNRIIAGLSKGVLIVSGATKSGTLYTAEYAEEYGRTVFAIPYNVGIEAGAGCNELIKRGAVLTDKPEDILQFYNLDIKNKGKEQLSNDELLVLNTLKDGQKHIDKICVELNKQTFEVLPILSVLEIKGYVYKTGNIFGCSRNDLEE